ncbi:MAG: site-specific DNA-methyltransferase [Deltaproteobacteria bacterium]|nr:site-specific DNA-methyltransferase [Deltaproteobacteria bacterium]
MEGWKNQLYFSDNLEVLRRHIPMDSVDLIYLDPPFNSNATYNMLFKEPSGEQSAAQIGAFDDTWKWGPQAEEAFDEAVMAGPPDLAELLKALRQVLRRSNMLAYLSMMAVRLVEMHRVLKSTGSLFLHCDPTASHYIKLILDNIFSPKNFRNEIIWERSQPKGHATTRFSRAHDTIFYYSKSEKLVFNPQFTEHDPGYLEKFYRHVEPETLRRYTLDNLTNPNKERPNLTYEFPPDSGTVRVWRWTRERMLQAWAEGRVVIPEGGVARYKRYLDEMQGTLVKDIWYDIEHLHGSSKEHMGYQTQKPEALLERIIRAASHEGDVVLDPFCGCGTAVAVAERLQRRWIGIDVTYLAIDLVRKRLEDSFGSERAEYEEIGIPRDVPSAERLFKIDPFQFECWALATVGARSARDKRGADRGIDGVMNLRDEYSGEYKKIILQVKGGQGSVSQVRDLKGVLEREKAEIGVFLTLRKPTRQMREEADEAGPFIDQGFPEKRFPRLQILTLEEIFAGKRINFPTWWSPDTFKKSARRRKNNPEESQNNLLKELQEPYEAGGSGSGFKE